ncbi:MAG: type II 3-dehydroquinate dehydratase [Fusobacteriaceae bacterium]
MKILVIHGPNLNFLGIREPEIYGKETLEDINNLIKKSCQKYELDVETFQSNSEGDIINKLQENYGKADYLVINPGALTHYSIAIRDAILSTKIKCIEVHLSNVYAREEFRKKSVVSDIALGVLSGFGSFGYLMAIEYIAEKLRK